MLCDHLEGWDREGVREGDARGKRYGNIYPVFFRFFPHIGQYSVMTYMGKESKKDWIYV